MVFSLSARRVRGKGFVPTNLFKLLVGQQCPAQPHLLAPFHDAPGLFAVVRVRQVKVRAALPPKRAGGHVIEDPLELLLVLCPVPVAIKPEITKISVWGISSVPFQTA